MSRLGRVLALCALVAAVVVTAATTALGHSALLSSDPADRDRLDTAPDEVVLVFSEAPDPDLSRVSLFGGDGSAVVDDGDIVPDGGDPETVRVALPAEMGDGVYTVSWEALSTVDGHVTTGAFSFAVGDVGEGEMAPMATGGEMDHGSSPSPVGVAGRWMLYAGLAALLGWVLSTLLVFRGRPVGWRWALPVSWMVAVGGLALVLAAEAASVEVSMWRLLESSAGVRLLRMVFAVAAIGVVVAAAARRHTRWTTGLLGLATAVAMYFYTMSGHAGAPGGTRWLNVGSHLVHVIAIGVWIGGLWWLLWGMRSRGDTSRLPIARRFSAMAGVSLGAVVVTGTVRAWEGMGSWSALWSTDYGVAFLVKLGVVVPLVALGALNRYRTIPAMGRGNTEPEDGPGLFGKVVRGEVGFAVVVFAVTGVLASLPPPATMDMAMAGDGTAMEEAGERIVVEGSDFATAVRVTLEVDPGAVGLNEFRLRVEDYDTAEPVDASRVALELLVPERPAMGPTRLELAASGDGIWSAESTALAFPAVWEATAIIEAAPDGYEIPLEIELDAGGSGEPGMEEEMEGGG